MSNKRVVIVEDDVLIAHFFRDVCRMNGFEVVGVEHEAAPALACILEQRPDYVLMDVRLGGRRDGVDIGMAAYKVMPEIRIVYVTGSNEPPALARIQSDHPYRVLFKPVLAADIAEALE